MTITEIHEKLKKKETSCVEIVESYLSRIAQVDGQIHAFLTVTKESALQQARERDEELSQSEDVERLFQEKPLFGVPSAHKDLFSIDGVEMTAGSQILKGYVAPYDATSIAKVKNAGAILLGKLNEDAFGHGGTGQNSDFGLTHNPYDLSRVSGGSSSGSGASVSADMSVFALGTDTGGSIRNPASFTNTVGLKPTTGRVSRYGVMAMASSLDSIGHVTHTVEDSALVLSVTAGEDAHDATSATQTPTDYLLNLRDGVKGLKIGVPKEYYGEGIDPEISATVKEALQTYQKLGAELIDVSLPHTPYGLAVYYIVVPSEVSSNLARFDGIRFGQTRDIFGAEAKRRIMMGTHTLSSGFYDAYYLKAQKVRTLIRKDFDAVFEQVDVLVTPVTPVFPPKIGELIDDPLKNYMMDVLTVGVNLSGVPSLAIPAGFGSNGLPIGLQIIGKHFDEATLYRAGYAFEQETRYFERTPDAIKKEDK